MALRPQFALIHSEFNDFLFAPAGEEDNGVVLTVLSALTRLGMDPWTEAARLSELPKEAAVRVLAAAIAKFPQADGEVPDTLAIAARAVDRLPGREAPAVESHPPQSIRSEKTRSASAKWLLWVALAAAALLFSLSHLSDHHAPEPAPSAVSSPQR